MSTVRQKALYPQNCRTSSLFAHRKSVISGEGPSICFRYILHMGLGDVAVIREKAKQGGGDGDVHDLLTIYQVTTR